MKYLRENPSGGIAATSPFRGGFGRKLLVPPERGDAPKGQRGKRGNPSGGIAATSPFRGGFGRKLLVPPERGDAPKGQRGKRGNPSGAPRHLPFQGRLCGGSFSKLHEYRGNP